MRGNPFCCLLTQGREKLDVVGKTLDELVKTKEENGRELFDQSAATYSQSRAFMIIAIRRVFCWLWGLALSYPV